MTKRKGYQFWVPIIIVGVVICAIIAGFMVASQPLDSKSQVCKSPGVQHTMTVRTSEVTPFHVDAHYCDTLKIVNGTSSTRTVMFGHPEEMEPYDGILQKQLASGESFTVTLVQVGDFHFHEHELSLVGTFTVR